MNNGAHVLMVGRDQMLLQTRTMMFGAYFRVESAGRLWEVELALAKCKFDLAVLCWSVPQDEFHKMMALLESASHRPRIMILSNEGNAHPRSAPGGESIIDPGPYQLLRKAAEMVGLTIKPMGRKTEAAKALVG